MADSNVYSLEVDFVHIKTFTHVNVRPLRCKGLPIKIEQPVVVESDDDDIGLSLCDFSLLNIGSFVVSNDLYEYLKPLAGDTLQFIELQWQNIRMWLCNVINVIDCLDEKKSEMNSFGGVAKVVFDMRKVPEQGFFKIKEDNYTGIYLSPTMYGALIAYEPSGVAFEAATLS